MKKYKLTDETTIALGVTLYRIVALTTGMLLNLYFINRLSAL